MEKWFKKFCDLLEDYKANPSDDIKHERVVTYLNAVYDCEKINEEEFEFYRKRLD